MTNTQQQQTRDTRERRHRRRTVEHVNNTSRRDWARRACPPVTGPQLLSITKAPATNEWAVTMWEEPRTCSAHQRPATSKTANYYCNFATVTPPTLISHSLQVSKSRLDRRRSARITVLPAQQDSGVPTLRHDRETDHRGVLILPFAFYTTIVR